MNLPLARLAALASLVALALAGSGCADSSGDDDDDAPGFQYGVDEMRTTVVGDWVGDFVPKSGATTTLTLRLEHSPPGTKPACGNRALGTGVQCIDSSTLSVKGTLSTADGVYRDVPVEGEFEVMGLTMSSGWLSLRLEGDTNLSADWVQGGFRDGSVQKGGAESATFTLRR